MMIVACYAEPLAYRIKLMGAAVMSKFKFMTDTLGYTPEEAEKEIKRIAEEKKITGDTVDTVLFSTSE